MNEIKRSITIDATVDKVFNYVSNYQKWPEFYQGLSDVKPVTEKTWTTGSKFIYKVEMFGVNFKVGTEFRNFRKNEGWTGKSFKGIEHRTQWIFKNSNGKTEFTHSLRYKIPWYMGGKVFDNLLGKKTWTEIVENSLQNVKSILEATK